MAERRHEGPDSPQPEARSAVSAGPVRIDVVGVSVGKGRAVLSLSREFSTPWARKFNEVYLAMTSASGCRMAGRTRVSAVSADSDMTCTAACSGSWRCLTTRLRSDSSWLPFAMRWNRRMRPSQAKIRRLRTAA